MTDILQKIVAAKKKEVEQAMRERPLRDLMKQADAAEPTRDFIGALKGDQGIRLIAEVKKASPSKGVIREDFDPVAIAQQYAASGAAAISVLTDTDYFQGHLDYLRDVSAAVDIPVLRKDFVVHPYQIYEARVAGADAVLLIAECLSRQELRGLYHSIRDLGMAALVEFYSPQNLDNVLNTGTELIGVNNRNLTSFDVDLNHTLRLRKQIPEDKIVVGESGILTREDALLLQDGGVHAMLVGESLMRQQDIPTAVRTLLGTH
ncbi:MAG: indole-3-glycerol phosphate synthase TrpC [Aureliella sp.]